MPRSERLEAYHFHERDWGSYAALREWFAWEIPDEFNVAAYVSDRWAERDGDRTAILAETADGGRRTWTYADLDRAAGRLAAHLDGEGVDRGDRVGVCLPPRPEAAAALVACWKLGAVAVPLSTLFGPDALEHRLADAGVRAAVVGEADPFDDLLRTVDPFETLVVVDGDGTAGTSYEAALEGVDRAAETVATDPEDDALVLYTSGTTGDPKGVLHAHRFLLNNLPGFLTATCNLDLREGDTLWTPAEWAWFATLFCVLLPALFYGKRVLAYDGGEFDPGVAWDLLERHDVTQFVAPPTALRRLREADDGSSVDALRTITCGAHDADLAAWTAERFPDAVIHENYGQTEAGTIVGECTALVETEPGCMGMAVPGYDVTTVDPETAARDVGAGELGEIATRVDDRPVCLKSYWRDPEQTDAKVADGWLLTGDFGRIEADGTAYFESRKDEVIISAGHSIGPEEVENCLLDHEAVAEAGVIGVPDAERGEVPKAFVELAEGYETSEALASELRTHVRERLAKYKYPREVEVLDALPMERGKVQRDALRRREATDDDSA